MTFEEWKILVKGLKSAYTSERFLPDMEAVKIWYSLLNDIDYQTANTAIMKLISVSKFPPSIAEIREAAASVSTEPLPDWGEAWEKVNKLIGNLGMYREEEALAQLDDIAAQTVRRLGFRNLCISEDTQKDRANFRDIYNVIAQRHTEAAQMPERVKAAIEQRRADNITDIVHTLAEPTTPAVEYMPEPPAENITDRVRARIQERRNE